MTQKKNILVTGCTGGIGKAIARELSDENIILIGRDANDLAALGESLPSDTEFASYVIDLSSESNLQEGCEEILAKYEKIDWIVHSAGFISKDDSFENSTNEITKMTFKINLFSVLYLTKFFLPYLTDKGGSIAISSTAAIGGNGRVPAYAASKGALNVLFKSIALSWKETDKRSVVICPGPTNTRMREEVAGDSSQHQSPEMISETVRKVIEDAEKFPNGSILCVDKGEMLILPT